MKIVFIEPAASKANVYSKLHMPLLGPVYLGSILKNRGHEVEIYNEDIYKPDYTRLEADVIGISVLTSTAQRGYEIAKKFPKEKVIIGGVHASLLPEEALGFARQVVVGEAEEVIAGVVEGKLLDPIVNGGPVQNLDSLPFPDFSLIKGYKLPGMLTPVSTSRGCPFDCTFCSVTKVFGRAYRFRSAENVMGELKSRKYRYLFFCDDNFTAHPKRTRRLLQQMIKHKVANWACQVRCDAAGDSELLTLMAKAGCQTACIGFESINAKTLESYNKKQGLENIIDAIRAFHKEKIRVHGMFVLGSDDDSVKTIWDTLLFAIRQKIDTIQMAILTPFPGTAIYETLKKQQRIFSYNWSLYDGHHTVFIPKLLSARQLQLNILNTHIKFYSLSHSITLFIRLHFRNALFRLMGYRIVRDWIALNRKMEWLQETS